MKSTYLLSSLRFVTPALVFLAAPASSQAISINLGTGAGPGTVTSIVYDDSYPKWLVADVTDRVNPNYLNVVSSPTSGAWTLHLSFPAGSPDLTTGATFEIEQLLTVDPASLPVSGWQQRILTADWEWDSGALFNFDTALLLPGLATTGQGSSTLTSSFDPISAPVNFSFAGTLKYNGAGGPATPLSLAISPVPEPGPGITLMALMAASLVLLRRRPSAPAV